MANTTESTKIKKKKDSQTKKKISKKVKLSEKKVSDNYEEQAKGMIDEVAEVTPLKEITDKKTGWWSK